MGFHPIAGKTTIRAGRVRPGRYVFYPYGADGQCLFRTDQELKQGAPEFYRAYLAPHQDELARRKSLRKRHWWELVEPRPTWQPEQTPKIVSGVFAGPGGFAYDSRGRYAVVQGLAWLWKGYKFSKTYLPWAYLALLNSSVFSLILSHFCRQVRGSQFDMHPAFVKKAFLPNLDSKLVSPKAIHHLTSLGRAIARGEPPPGEALDQAAALAYGIPLAELRGEAASDELERRFQELAKEWRGKTSHLSSTTRMAKHPAYRAIVSMGWAVVPLLLAELRRKPDFWFQALREITGEDPVPAQSAGKIKEMARAWVEWGQARGHLR